MINFHLLAGDVLDGLVLVFSVMVDDDLFDIVEHSFQFIEADVVLMSFLMHKQVLLYLIILLNSWITLAFHRSSEWRGDCLLRVDLSEIDIISQFNVLHSTALIKSRVAAI